MGKLIAQKRTDYTGKTVTRWVRAVDESTPAIKAPPVKAKNQSMNVENAMDLMFRYEENPDDGSMEMITVTDNPVFYTPEFAKEAMSKLPAATLRAFTQALENLPEKSSARIFLTQQAYDHIREMSDMGQTGAAKSILAQDIVRISNAALFSEAHHALAENGNGISYSDYRESVNRGVALFEGRDSSGWTTPESTENYLKRSKADQEKVLDTVMLACLGEKYDSYTDDATAALVAANRGNWGRLVEVVAQRGLDHPELIQDILNDPNAAVSEGML